ncbi:type II toxin-antitoxin system RelE family toxin [Streptomyces cellulosae]|uniref:Type II toxin-antitoxin system RelE/ParE family toxin n=1 Tax=Streptomyces cellulosae TaxID=1968 RepID=A0ABW6JIP8_STRCE
MSEALTETASAPAPLAVHYSDSAATSARQLDDRLRRTLGKALQVLADNPFPPQSSPRGDDMFNRRVRASQSLVVDYRASEQHLLVEAVTQVPKDAPADEQAASGTEHQEQFGEGPPPEQGADPQPPSVQWERVTVAPFRDLAAPPVASHGGL